MVTFLRGKRIHVNVECEQSLCLSQNMDQPVTEAIRELRERAGLTMREMAQRLGFKGASGYQRYEDPTTYKKKHIHPDLAANLANVLAGKGNPRITEEEIFALAGVRHSVTNMTSKNKALTRKVPVLELVEAGKMADGLRLRDLSEPEAYVELPGDFGPETFCVIVPDESNAPDFKEGDYLSIDPDAEIKPGDYVLVKANGREDPIIRKYRPRQQTGDKPDSVEFAPRNENFPVFIPHRPEHYKIIGRCISHTRQL